MNERTTLWLILACFLAIGIAGIITWHDVVDDDSGPLTARCDGHHALIYEQDGLVLRVVYPHEDCGS